MNFTTATHPAFSRRVRQEPQKGVQRRSAFENEGYSKISTDECRSEGSAGNTKLANTPAGSSFLASALRPQGSEQENVSHSGSSPYQSINPSTPLDRKFEP